jgi:hypothetical protein
MRRLAYCLLLAVLVLSACTPSLESKLIGNWVNASGYSIEFRAKGEGFIPGVEGQLTATSFKYTIVDENHISITLNGQQYTIGIEIKDDTLTWKDQLGDEVYTRVKK